jgi:hypothetical protein
VVVWKRLDIKNVYGRPGDLTVAERLDECRLLNPNLRREGDELRLLFSYTPDSGVEPLESPRHALPRLQVERRNGVLCTRLALGPASIAIYTAERFTRIGRQ